MNKIRDAESPRSRGYSEFERGDELRFRMRRMGGGLLLAVPGKVDLQQIIQLLLPVPREGSLFDWQVGDLMHCRKRAA
jgi:hypothetical protein